MLPDLVSVIIPAHNARGMIDEQLAALAAQDYQGAFEVIVSDNGSTDGLREHLAGHPLTPQLSLKYVASPAVPGAAHARNVGAARCDGDLLAFCDADDRVYPGWLTGLTSAASEFDAVGGPVEVTTLNTARVASWRSFPEPGERFADAAFLPYALSSNFAVWRTTFDKVGGFDESFDRGGEDVALSWALQLAGHTLGHTPDAMIAYRLRPTFRGTWRQMMAYGASSVRLHLAFRDHGMPGADPRAALLLFVAIVLSNPLVPRRLTPVPRGFWVTQTAFMIGRVRGSIRHRTYFV
ncbi:glycosyltransferase [Rhodococcus sp. D2-41]|uniref:glycosyltransferase n=1 Tax=Speluncibacter jeojiensis TaxID=2710754 RepID=UPI0024104A30|nr:glycosyltransferase [Rhodococcus sp. D2-41]MDG3009091.1 glycosyltransferase [Rhodococcus sp. D2-41]